MLVMDAMADILKREGIRHLFCFPTTPIIEAAVAAGLTPIICRQERVGVDMASGFARTANGRPPAVFAMQYGPGAENAFPGIASAYSDSSPILFLPLGHPRDVAHVFPFFNSTRTYQSVTKHVEPLTSAGAVGPVMRRAFNALRNGRLGPVMVEVPTDLVKAKLEAPRPMPTCARFGARPMRGTSTKRRRCWCRRGRRCSMPGRACSMPRRRPSWWRWPSCCRRR